ncbi:MAG: glycerate 2-kinase, partial [Gammaproteobacteria bacterium]
CQWIEVVEAAHPVPDEAGQAAAARILALAESLGPEDHLLCLISGGGSALLAAPVEGVSLADKQAVNRALLKSGANIHQMNIVRKHLSAIKGGRLAAASYPATTTTLLISDVPGDDPSTVASGPTVGDPSTLEQARDVLASFGVDAPPSVRAALLDTRNETPGVDDPRLARSQVHVLACAQDALRAASELATAAGVTPVVLGDTVEGEARDVALVYAALVRQIRAHAQPFSPPCVLLSGGETTVTVRGDGRGGRNAEFLLALAIALDGMEGVYALACDTDGIDGTEDNAGCICAPDTLTRARQHGLDAKGALADNDGYGFFEALDDLIITGPTRTNVNDFRAILIV